MVTTGAEANCGPEGMSAADIAFMVIATTFVLLQTPAAGIAQAGMIRRKNSLSMLAQTLAGVAVGVVLWFTFGFSVTFGKSVGGWGLIGGFDHLFFIDVPFDDCMPYIEQPSTIPAVLFASFQMMFAVMVPCIVTGAWAERLSFEAFLFFVTVWPVLVYYPLAHWIWADGWLARLGLQDFAGGLVIHASSGVAGFVVSAFLQPRKNKEALENSAHNLPLSVSGGILIIASWNFFNGGSAYKANHQAASALINTQLSAWISSLLWMIYTYRATGKYSVSALLNGALAGLGSITAGSGFVLPYGAFVIGMVSGSVSYWSVSFFKSTLNIDDVLDVAALQGSPGLVGSILVGVFSNAAVSPGDSGTNGLLYGGGFKPLLVQLLGAAVTIVWSGVMTWVVMGLMKRFIGVDVDPHTEEIGLDKAQIGEQAYDQDLDELLDLGADVLTEKLCEAAAKGELVEVKRLVAAGARPDTGDYDSRTPAHLAASEGRLDVLRYLVKQDDVDVNARDRWGGTPLTDAVRHRRADVVAWLKANGGHMQHTDAMQGELHDLAANGKDAELAQLLDSGIDPNIPDYDRRTAIHLAAAEGHASTVQLLVTHKADVMVRDRWGALPVADAIRGGFDDVVDVLSKAMGQHAERHIGALKGQRKLRHGNPGTRGGSPQLQMTRVLDGRADGHADAFSSLSSASPSTSPPAATGTAQQSAKQVDASTPLMSAVPRATATPAATVESKDADDDGDGGDSTRAGLLAVTPADDTMAAWFFAAAESAADAVAASASGAAATAGAPPGSDSGKLSPSAAAGDSVGGRTTPRESSDGAMGWFFGAAPSPVAGVGQTRMSKQDKETRVRLMATASREFCAAAADGDLRELRRLVHKSGVDLVQEVADYDGRTPLHLSSCNGHLACVQFLVQTARVPINATDRWHNTALQDAISNDQHHVARWLRSQGGMAVNKQVGHALCLAAFKGDLKELAKLVAAGHDVNTGDYDARCALHLSASEGHKRVCKWLLSHGAHTRVKDRFGGMPVDDARRHGHDDVVALLTEAEDIDDASSVGMSSVATVS